MRLLLSALVALLLLAASRPASACSESEPRQYWPRPDLAATDTTPPTGVLVHGVIVRRAVEPLVPNADPFQCGERNGSAARVRVEITPSTDDTSDSRDIGYLVEHVAGRIPRSFALPREPLVVEPAYRGEETKTLDIAVDDRDDDAELDFTLRLIPIDEAGNRGPPSEPFRVRDEGLGCSSAGTGPAPIALSLVALALTRRRRSIGVF